MGVAELYWHMIKLGEALHSMNHVDRYITTGYLIQGLGHPGGTLGPQLECIIQTMRSYESEDLGTVILKHYTEVQREINTLCAGDTNKLAQCVYTVARLMIKPDAYGGISGGSGFNHLWRIIRDE